MNKTGIEWCDWTWNPIAGCSPASEGCNHCYAAAISRRFNRSWGKPVFHPERLDQPARVKKPGRVFVCSMSDLFHESVTREWKQAVFTVACNTPRHTFMFLTKRPERVMDWWIGDVPNIWLGVTAENQARADERIPILLGIPAAVRFVSVEPMLGPVDLTPWLPRLDWVIAGPETGPAARTCDPAWIDHLAAHCTAANVPFFDKRPVWMRREWPRGEGR